jgi:small subunit ribosomal protein S2
MPFVNERWLGGMLTNFATISSRTGKLREYEAMERAGDFEAMPKKEGLRHRRELEKLRRNLGGIRDLERLPDAVFVIDTKKEHIAVTEANKLGMPIVAVVDTNCDPDVISYVIPGNDDAIRSGALMCRVIADAVTEGRWISEHRPPPPAAPAAAASGPRGRSASAGATAAPAPPRAAAAEASGNGGRNDAATAAPTEGGGPAEAPTPTPTPTPTGAPSASAGDGETTTGAASAGAATTAETTGTDEEA